MPTTGKKSNVALFGGSFDPVHLGHLHLLHEVYLNTDIRTVVIIPSLVSNFKRRGGVGSFSDRYNMLSLAIEDYRDIYPEDKNFDLVISRVEEERGGISYTSETIKHFLPIYGQDGRISFLMGDDLLKDLEFWHDSDYLRTHVRFFVFSREDEISSPEGFDITLLKTPVYTASSSAIRKGEFDLLPERVREYIERNGLYR